MSTHPLNRILVVGTHRLAGFALAERFAERYEVIRHPDDSAAHAEAVIAAADADVVIYCGPASESSWSIAAADGLSEAAVDDAASWAKLAGNQFIAITSDAVFTGPFMFHSEDSESLCSSEESQTLLAIESAVIDACPDATIIRTHVFGISPTSDGLVEQLLSGETVAIAGGGHATPISGADLADRIERTMIDPVGGVIHLSGAERVSARQFAERLIDAFDHPRGETSILIGDHASGFASGDRAMVCSRAKQELGLSMPLLNEGLARFRDLYESQKTSTQKAAA